VAKQNYKNRLTATAEFAQIVGNLPVVNVTRTR